MKHRCLLLIPSLVLILLTFSTLCTRPALSTPGHPREASRTSTTIPMDSTPVSYYQTIIDNNIFRPLGYTPPVQRPQYELIGTITGTHQKAFILDKLSQKLYTVRVGDKIGNGELIDIFPKRVTLNKDGVTTRLMLRSSLLR